MFIIPMIVSFGRVSIISLLGSSIFTIFEHFIARLIARNAVHYRQPLPSFPEPLHVGIAVTKLGTSSVTSLDS